MGYQPVAQISHISVVFPLNHGALRPPSQLLLKHLALSEICGILLPVTAK